MQHSQRQELLTPPENTVKSCYLGKVPLVTVHPVASLLPFAPATGRAAGTGC